MLLTGEAHNNEAKTNTTEGRNSSTIVSADFNTPFPIMHKTTIQKVPYAQQNQ